jgi:hypothetical protein
MAHQVSAELLRQLRSGQAPWSHPRLSEKTTLWQGMADWPRPDIAFEDRSTNASLALEFKPPNQPKREYVTGLGQALTYLRDFEFAGLVVPERAGDGAEIAEYLRGLLVGVLSSLPIALLTYAQTPSGLSVLQPLKTRVSPPNSIPAGIGRDVFWGYWRDLSNHDLIALLTLADTTRARPFERVFATFWRAFATKGRARTWEGHPRKRKAPNAPSFTAERLNAFLAMRHAGLLSADGRVTADGHELMRIGKVYGADSVTFLEALARQVLTVGRHLDLILWVDDKQRLMPAARKRKAERYYREVDLMLASEGIISPPQRGAPKAHFLRDEPKLWNKLGLLVRGDGGRYFHPGYGLAFNWRKVISVLEASA